MFPCLSSVALAQDKATRIVTPLMKADSCSKHDAPPFPREAIRAGIRRGRVSAVLTIDENGKVTDDAIRVLRVRTDLRSDPVRPAVRTSMGLSLVVARRRLRNVRHLRLNRASRRRHFAELAQDQPSTIVLFALRHRLPTFMRRCAIAFQPEHSIQHAPWLCFAA